MKQKIIYFSSVHGTGKTTLIKEIAKNYLPKSVIVDLDQFQLYPKDYLRQQIYRLDVWAETLRNTQGDILLVDRSPYDGLIYSNTLRQYSETKFTDDDYECVKHSFLSRHPDYRNSGYIVYLVLDLDENLKNIEDRGSEDSNIMFDPNFIKQLRFNFNLFYNYNLGINTSRFNSPYDADSIVKELLRKCILQPNDVHPSQLKSFERNGYQKD